MGYFYCTSEEVLPVFNIPKINFVSLNQLEIISILEYYRDERGLNIFVPAPEQIPEVDRLQIICGFPIMHKDHFIKAEVRKGFKFLVNANAFEFMKNLGENYENRKMVELYRFKTLNYFGSWFLPREIMEGIRNYNWDQHQTQVSEWMAQGEEILNKRQKRENILVLGN